MIRIYYDAPESVGYYKLSRTVRIHTGAGVRKDTGGTVLVGVNSFELLPCESGFSRMGEPVYEGLEKEFCAVRPADLDQREPLLQVGVRNLAVIRISVDKNLIGQYGI